jgi:nitroreductase
MGIIEFKEKGAVPTPTPDADEICISCGHCVAVCPEGAFRHSAMTPEACPAVHREWRLEEAQVVHFLRSRRSIRVYKRDPVDRDTLNRLIDLARYAPSGHNMQPVRWRIVYEKPEVRRLAGLVVDWMRHLLEEGVPLAQTLHMDRIVAAWERGADRICRDAPHLIVAHAPREERTAAPACTIALTYLELAAPSFGLGTCWAGYFNAASNMWRPSEEALALPEGDVCFGAMMIGYPKYPYHRLPLRNQPAITWA